MVSQEFLLRLRLKQRHLYCPWHFLLSYRSYKCNERTANAQRCKISTGWKAEKQNYFYLKTTWLWKSKESTNKLWQLLFWALNPESILKVNCMCDSKQSRKWSLKKELLTKARESIQYLEISLNKDAEIFINTQRVTRIYNVHGFKSSKLEGCTFYPNLSTNSMQFQLK